MQYRIDGAWRDTGADGSLTIDAASEQDARAAANGMGLLVRKVEPAAPTRVHLSGAGALWGLCAAVLLLGVIVGAQSFVTWQREQEARQAMEQASAEAAAALAEYQSRIEKLAREAAESAAAADSRAVTEEELLAAQRAEQIEQDRERVAKHLARADRLMEQKEWLMAAAVLTDALRLVEAHPDEILAFPVWAKLATAWQEVAMSWHTFSRSRQQAFDQALRQNLRCQQELDQANGPLNNISVLHAELVLGCVDEYRKWYLDHPQVCDWINRYGVLSVDAMEDLRTELGSRRQRVIEALLPERRLPTQ